MRLDQAITDYLASLAGEGRSPGTIDAYRRDLRLLTRTLGEDRDVATVTPPDLLAFAASAIVRMGIHGVIRHQGSINRTRTAVRGLFDFLVRAWAITADPAKVLRVRATAPLRATLLERSAEERLLATIAADPSPEARRDGLMVRLLIATGIRISSLVALDVADVDLENERLSVPYKGSRRMTVAIHRALAEELRTDDPGPLFRSRRGGRLSTRQVQLRFAAWVEEAEVNDAITPHALRHTFGTRLYSETHDLRRVQVALGHRSVGTTERYVVA